MAARPPSLPSSVLFVQEHGFREIPNPKQFIEALQSVLPDEEGARFLMWHV